ncbi:MAG: hypothetical protein JJU41_03735 [Bacteroidetes bacterium]|nr:hypothetical protein [Bacteroidota bacterium]
MTRLIIFLAVIALGTFACNSAPAANDSKSTKAITIEVTDTQVLLLDAKEVHIDYLNAVLSAINEEFDISAELSISPQAPMELVFNVQQSLNQHAVRVSNDG